MESREVIWSAEAIEDIDSIAEYIARDSRFYAAAVVNKLLASARELESHAEIGRVVPEFGKEELRERIVYSYRLVYLIKSESEILIVAVIHGKRLLEESISERMDG